MRVLRSIVQPLVSPMLYSWQDFPFRNSITLQFGRNDHTSVGKEGKAVRGGRLPQERARARTLGIIVFYERLGGDAGLHETCEDARWRGIPLE